MVHRSGSTAHQHLETHQSSSMSSSNDLVDPSADLLPLDKDKPPADIHSHLLSSPADAAPPPPVDTSQPLPPPAAAVSSSQPSPLLPASSSNAILSPTPSYLLPPPTINDHPTDDGAANDDIPEAGAPRPRKITRSRLSLDHSQTSNEKPRLTTAKPISSRSSLAHASTSASLCSRSTEDLRHGDDAHGLVPTTATTSDSKSVPCSPMPMLRRPQTGQISPAISKTIVTPKVKKFVKNLSFSEPKSLAPKSSGIYCSVSLDRLPGLADTLAQIKKRLDRNPSASVPCLSMDKTLCLYCDRSFTSQKLYAKHTERVHHSTGEGRRLSSRNSNTGPGAPTFPGCSYCNAGKLAALQVDELPGLFKHLCDDHNDKYFACRRCFVRFVHAEALHDHQEQFHPGEDRTRLKSETTSRSLAEHETHDESTSTTSSLLMIPITKFDDTENTDESLAAVERQTLRSSRRQQALLLAAQKLPTATTLRKKQMLRNQDTLLSRLGITQNRTTRSRRGCLKPIAPAPATTITTRGGGGGEAALLRSETPSNRTKKNMKGAAASNSASLSAGGEGTSGDSSNISTLTSSSGRIIFDENFYESVNANVRQNLSCHIDGKLEGGPSPRDPAQAVPSVRSTLVRSPLLADNEIHEATALSALTAFPTLLTAQQYGAEPMPSGKMKKPITKNSWKWKWDCVRKYKYVSEGGKFIKKIKQPTAGLRDLSKLDMWTQLTMRSKHEVIAHRSATDEGIVGVGEVVRQEKRRLITQLDAILDSRILPKINQEQNDQRIVKIEAEDDNISNPSAPTTPVKQPNQPTTTTTPEDLPSSLLLIRRDSSADRNRRPLVLSGEWARPRCYICFGCGARFENIKMLDDHKLSRHPHVQSTHYEIVGKELMDGNLFRHFFIPANALRRHGEHLRRRLAPTAPLHSPAASDAKESIVEDSMDSHTSFAKSSDSFDTDSNSRNSKISSSCSSTQRNSTPTSTGAMSMASNDPLRKTCTKCQKPCTGLMDLYRHMLDCSGDYAWQLAKKRQHLRHRYFGARRRRAQRANRRERQGTGVGAAGPKPERTRLRVPQPARPRPSDAESIQRMLADLPAKRTCHQTPPGNNPSPATNIPSPTTPKTPKALGARKFVSTTNSSSLVRSGGRKQILIKQSAGGKATRRFVATASTTVASIAKNMQMRKQKQQQQQQLSQLKPTTTVVVVEPVDTTTNDAGRSTRSTPLKDHETIELSKPGSKTANVLFKSIRRKTQRVVSKIANSLRNKKTITAIASEDPENEAAEDAAVVNGVGEKEREQDPKKEASSKKGFFRKTISFRKSKRNIELGENPAVGEKVVDASKPKPGSTSIVIEKKTRASKAADQKQSVPVEVPIAQAELAKVPLILVTESLTVVTASPPEVSSPSLTIPSPLAPILVSPSPSTSSIPQTPSPGMKRRPRKLNDCIAMLTGKLTEKLGVPFIESEPIVVPKPVPPTVLNVPSIPTVHAFLTGQELPTAKSISRTTITIPSYPVPTPILIPPIASDPDNSMILDLSIPKGRPEVATPQQHPPPIDLSPSPTQKRRTPRKPRNQRSNSIASYQELIIPTPPSSKQMIHTLTPNPLAPPIRDTISEIIFAVSRGEDATEPSETSRPPSPSPPPPTYATPLPITIPNPLDTCPTDLIPVFRIPIVAQPTPSPAPPLLLDSQQTPPPANHSFASSRIKLKPMSELLAPAPPPVKNTRSRRAAKKPPKIDVELLNRSDEDTSLVVSTPCLGDEDIDIPMDAMMSVEAPQTWDTTPGPVVEIIHVVDPPISDAVHPVSEPLDVTQPTRTTRRVSRTSETSANVPTTEHTQPDANESSTQSIPAEVPKAKSNKNNKTAVKSVDPPRLQDEPSIPEVSETSNANEPLVDNPEITTPTETANTTKKKSSAKKNKIPASPRPKRGCANEQQATVEPDSPPVVNELVVQSIVPSPQMKTAKLLIVDCMKDGGKKFLAEAPEEVIADATQALSKKQSSKKKAKRASKETEIEESVADSVNAVGNEEKDAPELDPESADVVNTRKKVTTKRVFPKRSIDRVTPVNEPQIESVPIDETSDLVSNNEVPHSQIQDRPTSTTTIDESEKSANQDEPSRSAEVKSKISSRKKNLTGKQRIETEVVESNIEDSLSKDSFAQKTQDEAISNTGDVITQDVLIPTNIDERELIQSLANEPSPPSPSVSESSPKTSVSKKKPNGKARPIPKSAKQQMVNEEINQVFDALKAASTPSLEEKRVTEEPKTIPIAQQNITKAIEKSTTNPFESDDEEFHPWDPEVGLLITTEAITTTTNNDEEPELTTVSIQPPRETASPMLIPKQQRKRRKNELAQIIADQLLESFKQVDQSRIGELKMLHDISIDSSSDDNLLRTTMSYTPPPKRKSASKLSDDVAAANAAAAFADQKGSESDASATGKKRGKPSQAAAAAKSIKSILSIEDKSGKADKKKRGAIRFNLDPDKEGHQSDTEVVQLAPKAAGKIMSRRQTICVESVLEKPKKATSKKNASIIDLPAPKPPTSVPQQTIQVPSRIPKKIRTSRRSIDVDIPQRFKRFHKAKSNADGKSKKSTVSNDMVAQIINDFTTSTIDSRNNSPVVFADHPNAARAPTTAPSLLNGLTDKPKNRTLELLRQTDKLNKIKSPLRAPFMSPRWEADEATPTAAMEPEIPIASWHTLQAATPSDALALPEKSILKSLKNKTKSLLGMSKKNSKKFAPPPPSAGDVVKRPLLRPSILNGTLNGGRPQIKAPVNEEVLLRNLEKNDLFIEKDLGLATNDPVPNIFAVAEVPQAAGKSLGFDAVKASAVTVRGTEVANTEPLVPVENIVQRHILEDLSKKIKPTRKMGSIKKRPARNITPAPTEDSLNTAFLSDKTLPTVRTPLSDVDKELLHFDCSQDTVLSAIVNRICSEPPVESEDEDLCLSQIAKTLNSKLMTTDEFNNDEPSPDPPTIFKVPSDLDAIRSETVPENDALLAVANDSLDMDENTNTDLVDMDLEDSMSVYTSFSTETSLTASGGRKKKRRSRKSIISKSSRKAKRMEEQFLSPASFHCTICDKPFSSQAGLTSHKSTLKHISKLSEQEFLQSKESVQQEVEPEVNIIDTPDANAELPCGTETRTSSTLPQRPQPEHIPESTKPASLPNNSRSTPISLSSPVRIPPPPMISNTYRPSGIEPISSPEQPDHTSDRYNINSRLALPMLGSPRQVLSQEERLFYECCSMLKGSERRVSDSPPTYYQLPRIHSSEMIMANNKPVTPRSNEQYSYVVPEGSKGKGTPKIDLNQFSDISSDSNPAYSCPQIPSSSAETQHIFARQPKTTGLLFGNAYSAYGAQRDPTNHSAYPGNTSAAMENIASAKSHVPGKHPDIGDSFQSSQDAIENVEHFGGTSGVAANCGIGGASTTAAGFDAKALTFERILERDCRKGAAVPVVGTTASLVSSELPPGLCETRSPFESPLHSASSQSSTVSKPRTKAAMKGYENFKVSIPTTGLDIQQALNRSPNPSGCKLAALADIALGNDVPHAVGLIPSVNSDVESSKTGFQEKPTLVEAPPPEAPVVAAEKIVEPMKHRGAKVNHSKGTAIGNKLGFNHRKKKASSQRNKSDHHKLSSKSSKDVFDFDDSHDSFDAIRDSPKPISAPAVPVPVDLQPDDSQMSSYSDRDDFNYENSPTSESDTSEAASCITKRSIKSTNNIQKKCLIMGRIFKGVKKVEVPKEPPAVLVVDKVKKPIPKQELDKMFDSLREAPTNVNQSSVQKPKVTELPPPEQPTGKSDPPEPKPSKSVPKGKSPKQLPAPAKPKPPSNRNRSRKSSQIASIEEECGMSMDKIYDLMGVGQRKTQRRCTTNKQKTFAETWSSDEYEDFHTTEDIIALIQQAEQKANKSVRMAKRASGEKTAVDTTPKKTPIPEAKSKAKTPPHPSPVAAKAKKTTFAGVGDTDDDDDDEGGAAASDVGRPAHATPRAKIKNRRRTIAGKEDSEPVVVSKKKKSVSPIPPPPEPSSAKLSSSSPVKPPVRPPPKPLARRKRVASEMLYYWSSSSDEEFGRIKPRETFANENLEQHGWIVGDSHKKLVTLLAHAKGKKIEDCGVKEAVNKKK